MGFLPVQNFYGPQGVGLAYQGGSIRVGSLGYHVFFCLYPLIWQVLCCLAFNVMTMTSLTRQMVKASLMEMSQIWLMLEKSLKMW